MDTFTLPKVPTPENLPLLLGEKLDFGQQAALETVLKGTDIQTALKELGKHWKIKVWFSCEHDIRVLPHVIQRTEQDGCISKMYKSCVQTNVHIFSKISTATDGSLLYATSRNNRHGYYFPALSTILKYEPIISRSRNGSNINEFESYEQFRKKFDPQLITQSEIQKLWNQKSSQHGRQYLKSDFHRIGRRGKEALERFLRFFSLDATEKSPCYMKSSYGGYYLNERYKSMSTHQYFGRDISIEHRVGAGFVHYSSEYPGCGNGRYGLLANKNEFLWLEDD